MGGTDGAFALAGFASGDCRRSTDRRATRLVAGGVCLPAPATARTIIPAGYSSHFLLHCESGLKVLHRSLAWSASAAFSLRGSKESLPKEAVQAAHRRISQSAHGKLLPRPRRPHRRVHPDPCRRQPLLHLRLHRADLGAMRVSTQWPCPLLQKFGLDRATRGRGHGSPAQHEAASPAEPLAGRNSPSRPAGAAATSTTSALDAAAGAFLLMQSMADWLATAEECFADEYGSLRQGLLTKVSSRC